MSVTITSQYLSRTNERMIISWKIFIPIHLVRIIENHDRVKIKHVMRKGDFI